MAYFNTSAWPLSAVTQTRADLQKTLEELAPTGMLLSVSDAGTGATPGFLKKTGANTVAVQTADELRAFLAEVQSLTGDGAVNATTRTTKLLPAAATAYNITIADGTYDAQEKMILFTGAIGSAATFALTGSNLLDFTTITFSINARSALMLWSTDLSKWCLAGGNADVA